MIQHFLEDNMVSLTGENDQLDDVTMAYIKIVQLEEVAMVYIKNGRSLDEVAMAYIEITLIGRGGYEISDLGRERTHGTGSLDTDLETSSRVFDRQLLRTLNDPYRKSILFDRLRTTYRNSTFTSLYHKYGY